MEQWKDIEGYEGLYEVSNMGRVRNNKGKILKPQMRRMYLSHILYKDGIPHNWSVHRLVAKAFIPNPNNYEVVNHKDENKLNNEASNLEWCTTGYNCNYGTRNIQISHKLSKKVYQFTLDGEYVNEYPSANVVGIDPSGIRQCCRGVLNFFKGFIWKYDNIPPTPVQPRKKPIIQYTLDGEFVREWESAFECGKNGYHQSHVMECCQGKQKSHKGFIWKYK